MIVYSETIMLSELLAIIETIPSEPDKNFLEVLNNAQTLGHRASMNSYNRLLDLYNKYIVVPAGDVQTLRNYNYHE